MQAVHVIGVGMSAFGRHPDATLKSLTQGVVHAALDDAEVDRDVIEAAYVANAIGGSITGQEMVAGQVALRSAGLDGIPVFNIENACASGSSAVHLAASAIAAGLHEYVVVLGVEKMTHPDKRRSLAAIGGAADVEAIFGDDGPAASDRSYFMDLYASLAQQHMDRYGSTPEDFAAVAVKNQRHGAGNPRAQYGGETTIEEVLAARMVVSPLTVPMCSPVSDGAAAIVLAAAPKLGGPSVSITASTVASGSAAARLEEEGSAVRRAAGRAFEMAGVGPDEIDLAEVHDATASAEIKIYEELGLCAAGEGHRLIREGRTTFGGDVVVNPSGGLLAKGHPIGATGVAQIVEAVEQLSGRSGPRQVDAARWALTQNAGGWIEEDNATAAVTILRSGTA